MTCMFLLTLVPRDLFVYFEYRLVHAIVAQLPELDTLALCNLAIFPYSFDLAAAAAVSGLSTRKLIATLRKLVLLGMVLEHAFEDRYHLDTQVKSALQHLCVSTQMNFDYARCAMYFYGKVIIRFPYLLAM